MKNDNTTPQAEIEARARWAAAKETPSSGSERRLVRLVVNGRRGKPGQLQKEIAEALIPIVAKYRSKFGTLGQVAGCASSAASHAIQLAIYYPPNETNPASVSK